MDGPKGRGMLKPRGGGLTSDCHATPRNAKGSLALLQPTRKGGSDTSVSRVIPKSKDTKRNCSEKQSPARSGLTCQERRGRRHLVPERETHALGSEFTRAKPGPYTSSQAGKPRIAVSGITSLGANSLPVGESPGKGARRRTRSSGTTL